MIPQVDSADEARAAVRACRYAPAGARSIGPTRAKLYGKADTAAANATVLCLPMIESLAGLEAVEEIAAVDGVDGLFVGPADLGLDTGLEGGELDDALRRIAATVACHAAVKANYPLTPDKMRYILDELRRTAYSSVCPHGRPVVLRLTRREIEKNFQRI